MIGFLDEKGVVYSRYSDKFDTEAVRLTTDRRRRSRASVKIKKGFFLILCITVCYIVYFFSFIRKIPELTESEYFKYASPSSIVTLPMEYEDDQLYKPVKMNSTLGFERVFILNLDMRTDRRDLMSLMGLISDIDFEYISAFNKNNTDEVRMPNVALHPQFEQDSLTQGQFACYRSNLNIMRRIVEERIESALIIQDDAEWDLDFKLALERLQGPFSSLLQGLDKDRQRIRAPKQHDPWHTSEWDIFWLGASDEKAWPKRKNSNDPRPYVIYNDDLVTLEEDEEPGGRKVWPNYGLQRARQAGEPLQRLVQQSRFPVGMAAYAVTLSGAAQILAHASYAIRQPYDLTVCALSRVNNPLGYPKNSCLLMDPVPPKDESVLRSYSVWPPLVTQFRSPTGERDSDLTSGGVKAAARPLTSDGMLEGGKAGRKFGYGLEIRKGVKEQILSRVRGWRGAQRVSVR
ncbi:uncharacterized protein FA14DRAFT_95098 [Meira miltonrushii]|uniref:Glycosyl transferase family 25 domain-containing protein n=1 Tax=Meira miltonrushii TaxID=1280837 RepID=A0A316V1E3_9BASI|nr:uncharacterized protein FA14DRAFT_95098 [Meira miltonrushii]PWN31377.1 hypothetical protein FA14DRAFT_95098 [Meira miltonrushii]